MTKNKETPKPKILLSEDILALGQTSQFTRLTLEAFGSEVVYSNRSFISSPKVMSELAKKMGMNEKHQENCKKIGKIFQGKTTNKDIEKAHEEIEKLGDDIINTFQEFQENLEEISEKSYDELEVFFKDIVQIEFEESGCSGLVIPGNSDNIHPALFEPVLQSEERLLDFFKENYNAKDVHWEIKEGRADNLQTIYREERKKQATENFLENHAYEIAEIMKEYLKEECKNKKPQELAFKDFTKPPKEILSKVRKEMQQKEIALVDNNHIRLAKERVLIKYCAEKGIPTYGICGGMQQLNSVMGSDKYFIHEKPQTKKDQIKEKAKNKGEIVYISEYHPGKGFEQDQLAKAVPGTMLGDMIIASNKDSKEEILINGYHDMVIDKSSVAQPFRVAVYEMPDEEMTEELTQDYENLSLKEFKEKYKEAGMIEVRFGAPFFGGQYHPEMFEQAKNEKFQEYESIDDIAQDYKKNIVKNPQTKAIFTTLIEAARTKANMMKVQKEVEQKAPKIGDKELQQTTQLKHVPEEQKNLYKKSLPKKRKLPPNPKIKQKISKPPMQKVTNFTQDHDLLKGNELRNVSFKGQTLQNIDFSGKKLTNVSFEGATLINVKMDNAQLRHINMNNSKIKFSSMKNASIKGANMKNIQISRTLMDNAELQDINMNNAKLNYVNAKNTKMSIISMQNAKLVGVNVENAQLNKVGIKQAKLTKTNIDKAIISPTSQKTRPSSKKSNIDDLSQILENKDTLSVSEDYESLEGDDIGKLTNEILSTLPEEIQGEYWNEIFGVTEKGSFEKIQNEINTEDIQENFAENLSSYQIPKRRPLPPDPPNVKHKVSKKTPKQEVTNTQAERILTKLADNTPKKTAEFHQFPGKNIPAIMVFDVNIDNKPAKVAVDDYGRWFLNDNQINAKEVLTLEKRVSSYQETPAPSKTKPKKPLPTKKSSPPKTPKQEVTNTQAERILTKLADNTPKKTAEFHQFPGKNIPAIMVFDVNIDNKPAKVAVDDYGRWFLNDKQINTKEVLTLEERVSSYQETPAPSKIKPKKPLPTKKSSPPKKPLPKTPVTKKGPQKKPIKQDIIKKAQKIGKEGLNSTSQTKNAAPPTTTKGKDGGGRTR